MFIKNTYNFYFIEYNVTRVYFIRVSVKIDKSLYNRTADIKDIVRTELMSAEIKGVLWDYKIEQLDSGDFKDWERLGVYVGFLKLNLIYTTELNKKLTYTPCYVLVKNNLWI